ncbi:MAG: hypothetical protein KKB66_00210 [Alphaproteobacteria bacterium]|nr:hypothetical protein [Alphaproteobacteria bacterium]MBU0803056.1 hypothetical protein [Alphaproteobacteria bacterium]MBU0870833.1 hypothetical protein [Alphaproteobacteria bacterium]MBU1403730.1 hypothetical protein [Alphaproteobacteria bacterium]MBU1589565.1 hypothetical protein [Alphaproteobacteria bacterium]
MSMALTQDSIAPIATQAWARSSLCLRDQPKLDPNPVARIVNRRYGKFMTAHVNVSTWWWAC